MKSEILYVEKDTGGNHNGRAVIGKGFFSKTMKTIYFDGIIFQKGGRGGAGNHYDIDTGEGYWISAVKKNGQDRHKFGTGIIEIDENIVEEYLRIIDEKELQKNKFKLVQINNIPAIEKATEILNEKYEPYFDTSIRFKKKASDLTDLELEKLLEFYHEIDYPSLHKKGRKLNLEELKELEIQKEKRIKILNNA